MDKKKTPVAITQAYLIYLIDNRSMLVAFAASQFSDASAEDVFNDVYESAREKMLQQDAIDEDQRQGFAPMNNFKTYALRSIRNRCIDFKRRQKGPVGVENEVIENLTGLTSVIDDVLRRELIEIVRSCIASELCDSESNLLHLRFYEGLKLREIGAMIEKGTGSVDHLMRAVLRKVRACVEPKWFSICE